ncbi:MAG TPA: corrinoid protein, partial [Firmicutes bacterium]|nr:corrinoid protein [Bacillota bacterium]
LKVSIEELDPDLAETAAQEAKEEGINAIEAINEGLAKGMDTVSEQFDEGEVFVPDLLIAAEAFETAVEILTGDLSEEEKASSSLGKVLLHTVEGDIHDIGKNIVKTMLTAGGFEVIDLGRDVAVDEVVKQAIANNVDVIASSALMTTTMPAQRDIIRVLKEEGVRDQFKCIFGGAPVSQEWVDSIGADGYAESASESINLIKKLLA